MERTVKVLTTHRCTPESLKELAEEALAGGYKISVTPSGKAKRYTLEVYTYEPIFAYLAKVEAKLSDLACDLEDALEAQEGYKNKDMHRHAIDTKTVGVLQQEVQTLKDVIEIELSKLTNR